MQNDPKWTYIEDLNEHDDQLVTIKGWVYNRRSSGKIRFLLVRDGTGVVQCVATQSDLPSESFASIDHLAQESSVVVEGTVKADKRAPGGYELQLRNITLVHQSVDYPITPKEHGVDFLLSNRHLWLRSQRQQALMRVRAVILRSIRDFLDDQGFLEIDAPILTPNSVEGTTSLFEIDYFGDTAYLSQSGQLYVEAAALAFGRVYCFGPVFRAEKSKTRRHLMEFWMVEPEMAYFEHEDSLGLQERFVSAVVGDVLSECQAELASLERDTSLLEKTTPPFPAHHLRRGAGDTGQERHRLRSGAKISVRRMRPCWPVSSTGRCSSSASPLAASHFMPNRRRTGPRSHCAMICLRRRDMARLSAAARGSTISTSSAGDCGRANCRRTTINGISIFVGTAASRTVGLDWASNVRSPGYAAYNTYAKRSPSPEC